MQLGFRAKYMLKKQGEFLFHPAPASSCFHPASIVVGCCLEHFFLFQPASEKHPMSIQTVSKPPTSRQSLLGWELQIITCQELRDLTGDRNCAFLNPAVRLINAYDYFQCFFLQIFSDSVLVFFVFFPEITYRPENCQQQMVTLSKHRLMIVLCHIYSFYDQFQNNPSPRPCMLLK